MVIAGVVLLFERTDAKTILLESRAVVPNFYQSCVPFPLGNKKGPFMKRWENLISFSVQSSFLLQFLPALTISLTNVPEGS